MSDSEVRNQFWIIHLVAQTEKVWGSTEKRGQNDQNQKNLVENVSQFSFWLHISITLEALKVRP